MRPKVLILDDDDQLRESLSELLVRQGYRTYQADCGESALEIVRARWIDCGILDVHLPDGWGVGFLRQAIHLQPGLRAILVSAAGTPDLRGEALEAGAYFFLDKPFESQPIVGLVARAIRGESRPELPPPRIETGSPSFDRSGFAHRNDHSAPTAPAVGSNIEEEPDRRRPGKL